LVSSIGIESERAVVTQNGKDVFASDGVLGRGATSPTADEAGCAVYNIRVHADAGTIIPSFTQVSDWVDKQCVLTSDLARVRSCMDIKDFHAVCPPGVACTMPTKAPTRAPTKFPTDSPTKFPTRHPSAPVFVPEPAISVRGGDMTFIDVSEQARQYADAGAHCSDLFDAECFHWHGHAGCAPVPLAVTTTGAGGVDVNKEGKYLVHYSCSNSQGATATATRTVFVRDYTCPRCSLPNQTITVEASFPFEPVGDDAVCHDSYSKITVNTKSDVDVENTGSYLVTYSATDVAGNTDTDCGARETVQTVIVIDTLKPVIALYSQMKGSKLSYKSSANDVSQATFSAHQGQANPANDPSVLGDGFVALVHSGSFPAVAAGTAMIILAVGMVVFGGLARRASSSVHVPV
jgi:hypothetical protein